MDAAKSFGAGARRRTPSACDSTISPAATSAARPPGTCAAHRTPRPSLHSAPPASDPSHTRPSAANTLTELLARHDLRVLYGDLHNHTSYSDGRGTPPVALEQMRARGLDFAAVTDHGENLLPPEGGEADCSFDKWRATGDAARVGTRADFLALRGFEWSSDVQGHICVWSSGELTNWYRTGDETMLRFYAWLARANPDSARGARRVLAGFNHPVRAENPFDAFAFDPALDERIVVAECFNRTHDHSAGYFRLLDAGWHVGAAGCSDHHGEDWGAADLPRTGLLAAALTLGEVENALARRRAFATRSPALRLLLTGNNELMGARLTLAPREPLTLEVWCDAGGETDEAGGKLTGDSGVRFELLTDGGECVASSPRAGGADAPLRKWRHAIGPEHVRPERGAERWFVARVVRDGQAIAYTSPVWACWGKNE